MEHKFCHKCQSDLTVDLFNKNASCKDGYARTCRSCMKEYRKVHYSNNRENYIRVVMASNIRRAEAKQERLRQFFVDKKCMDCPVDNPVVLEFHHRIPELKCKSISKMMSDGNSWERVLQEIDKCDILCSNCHKIRTHKQFNTYRNGWVLPQNC
jgi:hypothetical protein